jgi:hypothetical protein
MDVDDQDFEEEDLLGEATLAKLNVSRKPVAVEEELDVEAEEELAVVENTVEEELEKPQDEPDEETKEETKDNETAE